MASLIAGELAASQLHFTARTPISALIHASGITTFADAANAVQVAYGFGYDLSTFLSALGVIAGGDLITGKYSIGGGKSGPKHPTYHTC